VIEFLIRTRATHEWPVVRGDRLAAVLTPDGWHCTVAEGWGDHRLRCDMTEIAFSGEPVGWQVSFEGPMTPDDAERFISAVARQVEQEVGEAVEWVQILW